MIDIQGIQHLSAQGQHQKAMDAAKKLLKSNPKTEAVLALHARIHRNAGEFELALKSYLQLQKTNPQNVDYLFGAALCHSQMGQFYSAEQLYLKLIKINPKDFRFRMNLGVIYRQKHEYEKSANQLILASRLKPNHIDIMDNLAVTLFCQQLFGEALEIYDEIFIIDPHNFRSLNNRGMVYLHLNEFDKAKSDFEACLKLCPTYQLALNNLGLVFLYTGYADQAEDLFHQAIENNPYDCKSYFNLISLGARSSPKAAKVFHQLEQFYDKQIPLSSIDRGLFALADFHHGQENIQKAYHYYRQGNDQVSRQRPYDNYKTRLEFKRIKEISLSLPDISPATNTDDKRIFIIGMPRSGTTLLESILASHPDIVAGDELPYFNVICKQTLLNAPDAAEHVSPSTLDDIATLYCEKTAFLFKENNWAIDKLPHNFKWTAVILKIFPDAKILHVHRDPMDNCWSLYRANFEQSHNYCYSMKSLGQYYAHYQKLMAFFTEKFGRRILSVSYDELVMQPEELSAEIFSYLGLDGYQFKESDRGKDYFSRTASATQVQQPISTSSLQGWRKHEDFLSPLLASLQKHQHRLGLPVYQA
ncbi:sulfotransferase [Alphaproteobacteria bacterium LSUCC0684]